MRPGRPGAYWLGQQVGRPITDISEPEGVDDRVFVDPGNEVAILNCCVLRVEGEVLNVDARSWSIDGMDDYYRLAKSQPNDEGENHLFPYWTLVFDIGAAPRVRILLLEPSDSRLG